MTFVVPFDGSKLSEVALVRASEYANAMDADVVAISVISERKRYAQKKGWIEEGETLDVEAVAETLQDRVTELVPAATFDYEVIRESPPSDGIADHIEQLAIAHGASLVFVGTDNVGRIATPLMCVGIDVDPESTYDIQLVRHLQPPRVDFLEPHPEFYDELDA